MVTSSLRVKNVNSDTPKDALNIADMVVPIKINMDVLLAPHAITITLSFADILLGIDLVTILSALMFT